MYHYIKHIKEHIEVFDRYNRFMFSADTEEEAIHELGLMLVDAYKNFI